MSRVFITGGTGLLGSNIIRELLARNYEVTALVEPQVDPITIKNLPVELIPGDILNPESYESALQSCDFLIHAAASTSIWPTRSTKVREINITGTQNMMNSALRFGLKKMVHVGTANTFGFGDAKAPGHEGKAFNSAHYGLDYIDSKHFVHHWILEQVKQHNLQAVIVNPTFMIGPYDSKPSSGEMIVSFYKGRIPGVTPGGRNFIYAIDAAKGVVNALEKGTIGESYILGNRNLNYKDFFAILGSALDKKPPKLSVPKWLMLGVAHLNVAFAKLVRKNPRTFPTMVRIAYDEQFFSAAKAVREIDLPQTDIEVAVLDCFNWLKDNHYL